MKWNTNLTLWNYNKLAWHCTCWMIFIAYELIILKLTGNKVNPPLNQFIFYALNIGLFYGLLGILSLVTNLPKGFLKFLLAAGSLIILLGVYTIGKFYASKWLDNNNIDLSSPQKLKVFMSYALFRGAYFAVLAMFFWAATRLGSYRHQTLLAQQQTLRLDLQKRAIANELVKSDLALKQQQISPHTIFNTLSFLYGTVHQQAAESAKGILLLSDLLHYTLKTSELERVSVRQEMEQINKLYEINQLRFDGKVVVNITIEDEASNYEVPPLLVFTVAENLFKHGLLTEVSNPGVLDVRIGEAGAFQLYSGNPKKRTVRRMEQKPPMGLQNLRTRLTHYYQDNYKLNIKDTTEYFELYLTIL